MTRTVFVHGRNADATSWNNIESEFDDGISVNLADRGAPVTLPALGEVGPILWASRVVTLLNDDSSSITMDNHIETIEAAMPDDQSEQAILIGHSMGGAVMSHFAAKYPSRVSRLIYVSAMLPAKDDTISELQTTFPTKVSGSIFARPFVYVGGFTAYLEDLRAKGTPPLFSEPTIPTDTRFPGGSAFDAIPKAYYFTRHDPVIPLRAQKDMTGAYELASEKVTDGGHLPQYEERGVLINWLKEQVGET